MKEAITLSIVLTYNLEENEIQGFLNPIPGKAEQQIVIFESEEGGTGVMRSLLNPDLDRFDKFVENMARLLHIQSIDPYEETRDACKEACYNCLLTFRNQREHFMINRTLVLPFIKKMKGCIFSRMEKESVDISEDHLEVLKSKCDSMLEKAVLDEIIRQKIDLPTEAQKIFFEGDIPIAKADFFYDKGTYGIYIFIDGPPHMSESVQAIDYANRRIIEDKHGNPVIALDFTDGEYIHNPKLIEVQVKKIGEYL